MIQTTFLILTSAAAVGVGNVLGGDTGIAASVVIAIAGAAFYLAMRVSKVLTAIRTLRVEFRRMQVDVSSGNRRMAALFMVFRDIINALSIDSAQKKVIHDRIDRIIVNEQMSADRQDDDGDGADDSSTMPS